jgi:hypothetical protein
VHHVNAQHYSQKKLNAWSPTCFDKPLCSKQPAKLNSFVVNE